MLDKNRNRIRIAVLWISMVVAVGAVHAGHRSVPPAPSPRAVLHDTANALERSAESLVRTVQRESRGRNPHDRRALNAANDVLFRSRELDRALYDPRLTDRGLARMLDGLLVSFEDAEAALRRARVSRSAWARFDRVGDDLGRLETVASRTRLATYRARPPVGGRLFAAELSRVIPIGGHGSLGVHIVYRSGR